MNEREHPEGTAKGDEAADDGEAVRADAPGSHEFPVVGPSGDVTDDDESLAPRPDKDVAEIDGNPDRGGTPPGTATHGS